MVQFANAQNSTDLMNQLKLAQNKVYNQSINQKTDTQKIIDLLTSMNTTLTTIQKELAK